MERGSSDVAASLLATERKGDSQPPESLPAGRTKVTPANGATDAFPGRRRATRTQVQSLLEDQRRFALRDGVALTQASPTSGGGAFARLPDMFGQGALQAAAAAAPASMSAALSTSAVVTTLQDAVLRWGASSSSSAARRGAAGPRDGSGGDGDSISVPHVRRSWRLVEAAHGTAVPAAESPCPPASWSVGQRWVRVDEVAQVNALAHAAWAELIMQPAREQGEPLSRVPERTGADHLYAAGLHMCFDATRSTAPLPVFLSAASSAVLAGAEAEEVREKKNACGCQFSLAVTASGNRVLHSTPSLAFFTFTESEYNAIVPPPPSSTRFTYASSCYLMQLWARFGNPVVAVDRWQWSESGGNDDRANSGQWVPTVEEVCAEYHRVTSGIIQRRQQQLREAVQLQELRLLGEPAPAPSPTVRAARGGGRRGAAAAVSKGSSVVAACTSTAAASRHAHPFVASFDRYALLQHTAAEVPADDTGAASAPVRRTFSSLADKNSERTAPLSPSSHGSSLTTTATASGDSGGLALDALSAPPSAGSTATAQERLTAQTTPSPWFAHDAEVHRRACLTRLLRREQQTNVPYQHAANRYLALAAGAAVALQRAVFAFYNRDDKADLAEAPGWKEEREPDDSTEHATLTKASIHRDRSSPSPRMPGRPPRGAFTVQLQPLPSVDPAAWRTAEVTVRKATAEVLGTVSSVTPAPSTRSPSRRPSHSAAAVAGPLKRARSATMAQGTTNSRRKGRLAVAKNAAEGVAAEVLERRNDRDEEVADSEALAPSETGSELSDNEQGHEGSVAGEEGDEGVKAEVRRGQRQRHPTRLSSPTPPSSQPRRAVGAVLPHNQTSHLPADATYAALQEYITDVLPFRCARLRGVVQAGWLLPAPPALPHTLTDPIEEDEVRTVDTQVRENTGADNRPARTIPSSPQPEEAPSTGDAAPAAHSSNSALLAPILTEEEYQELRKVSMAGVCNRVVSHTDEAVLLSLPPAVPRLHREVEQELERYLYEDTSALMEVNPVAQSLVGAIRVAYTQNKLLQRFAARLEHVLEGLKKVSEECEEEAQAVSRMR
ncbi:hypothetical protein GH5_05606 [Leishmania sp. Ghana 2012 LV757]|uniref:hypothetical protein n=1 Tax=Leishmania sp. Ghana 2012 LV757 TaxID=2803181 RepID=UPI001B785B45|nr:hypothetical protein GH5_05606 [Leishmania sp. Ghana 2012 LV757]